MYGENSGQLRHWLGVLLREHRIQQRLGGAGNHRIPVTTTIEERHALGVQVRRYRQGILTWTLEAVHAATPPNPLDYISPHPKQPIDRFARELAHAITAAGAGLPTLDELTTHQTFPTVETWRQAARAAALGEHDFPTIARPSSLSPTQRDTVLKDAADIVQALIVLDRRYKGVPGWEPLRSSRRLTLAAVACVADASSTALDYTVDRLGWEPSTPPGPRPTEAGFPGLLQAQMSLLHTLAMFPTALALRTVIESQRIVAHEVAIRLHEPACPGEWKNWEQAYETLSRELRALSGVLGKNEAIGAAGISAIRAVGLPHEQLSDGPPLDLLTPVCSRIRGKINAALEFGTRERLYLLSTPVARIDSAQPGLVKLPQHEFVPVPGLTCKHLTALLAKASPCPAAAICTAPAGRQNRLDFEATLGRLSRSRIGNCEDPAVRTP